MTDPAAAVSSGSRVILPLTLALISGVVDVMTFVLLGGLFTAHITGNLVVFLADLALQRPLDVAGVVSIPLFVIITAAVTWRVDRTDPDPWTVVRCLLAAQLLLVAAAGAIAIATDAKADTTAGLAVSAFAVAGMATQNTLLHLTFRKVPTTAVMTGNIVAGTVALVGLAIRGRHRDPVDLATWQECWPLLTGFLGGVVLGAIAAGSFGSWGWLLPIVLCAGAAAGSVLHQVKPPEIR